MLTSQPVRVIFFKFNLKTRSLEIKNNEKKLNIILIINIELMYVQIDVIQYKN